MVTFSDSVRARDDARLVALLSRRPDLASPSPSTLLSLAARATSRASVHRAVVGLDAPHLEVLESVHVLEMIGDEATFDRVVSAVLGDSPPADDVALVRGILDDLDEMALVWRPTPATYRPAPGVDEVQDTFPAGLGPATPTTSSTTTSATPVGANTSTPGTGPTTPTGATTPTPTTPSTTATPTPSTTPSTPTPSTTATPSPNRWAAAVTPQMREALDSAPAGARSILDALTWGPPVGRLPAAADGPTAAPTRWLLEQGFVRRADGNHVLLPREVALALRGGRTHRALTSAPTLPDASLDPATVEAESARSAQEVVRLVAELVGVWQEAPAAMLRSGGLGIRDLRRLGTRLEVDERTTAFVVELASMAGLVVDDGDDPASYAPTLDADDWLADDLPRRWATLVAAWFSSSRTPWLVGSRDERGNLRSALEPELHRAWVPRLRGEVLGVLCSARGTPMTADDVVGVLRWRTPRAVPPHEAVDALLSEASLLGVTGAGALSAAGGVLAEVPALTVAGDGARVALADTLAAALPEPVDDLLLQGDLTGIVPGRPTPALEALLAESASVESRGAAITVRFTPESVTRALDAGRTGDELLAELAVHARGGLPQPLEYLVRDAARRHGQLRLGAASAYVRVEDPVLLAGLVEDPRLRSLGLFRVAPTVLAASASPSQLLTALRERGLAPAMEGPDGQVVHADRRTPRVRLAGRRGRRRGSRVDGAARPTPSEGTDRLESLVAALRRDADHRDADHPGLPQATSTRGGPDRTGPSVPGVPVAHTTPAGTTEPVVALALLREAAADGREVLVDIVGASGELARRRLRPLRVDSGRLRAVDVARESELTVAVHRIANVEPIPVAR